MKKKNYNIKSLQIINNIQKIRSNNNKNWMNILKLAFKSNPKQASKILGKITTKNLNFFIKKCTFSEYIYH